MYLPFRSAPRRRVNNARVTLCFCRQFPDGIHVPVAVRVLHNRGVRGEGGPRALLHGDRRRSLVRH